MKTIYEHRAQGALAVLRLMRVDGTISCADDKAVVKEALRRQDDPDTPKNDMSDRWWVRKC